MFEFRFRLLRLFSSAVKSYKALINLSPSLGNLLLDITLCSISVSFRFRSGVVFFFVIFRVTVRVKVRVRG